MARWWGGLPGGGGGGGESAPSGHPDPGNQQWRETQAGLTPLDGEPEPVTFAAAPAATAEERAAPPPPHRSKSQGDGLAAPARPLTVCNSNERCAAGHPLFYGGGPRPVSGRGGGGAFRQLGRWHPSRHGPASPKPGDPVWESHVAWTWVRVEGWEGWRGILSERTGVRVGFVSG